MNLKMESDFADTTISYCEELKDLSLVLVTTRAVIDTMDDIRNIIDTMDNIRNIIDPTITRTNLLMQMHRSYLKKKKKKIVLMDVIYTRLIIKVSINHILR